MKLIAFGIAGLAIIGAQAGAKKRRYNKHRWCSSVWWNKSQLDANYADHPEDYTGNNSYQKRLNEVAPAANQARCDGFGFFQDGEFDYVLGHDNADYALIAEKGSFNDMAFGHDAPYKGAKKGAKKGK